MTLNVYPHAGPAHMHVACSPPSGLTIASLMRLDRNGRTVWPAEHLSPWAAFLYDDTCALRGGVEYVVTYSDGTREAATRTPYPVDDRPRLVRLEWTTTGQLTTTGSTWTEHAAVLDATYDLEDVTTVSRRGAAGLHATRNHDRADTGQLVIWCDSHAWAVQLRDDLARHPLQWLRSPDQPGMDHALIVTRLGIRHEQGAWLVDAGYAARADLVPVPHQDDAAHGDATLADVATAHATLADIAEGVDMLAELR